MVRTAFRQNGYDSVMVVCTKCKGSGKRPIYNGPTV